jgi:mono/diheme cytochrome c family protein
MTSNRFRHILGWALVAIVLLLIGWWVYDRAFGRDIPTYATDEEQFKYGSIGNDGAEGIPYAIWLVLPEVFPEYLPGPGGYASLGFVWEKGRGPDEPPIGFSRARVGVDRMAINCAICHVVSARIDKASQPTIYLAGAANTVDIQAYQQFLSRCAQDPRFNPDVLLSAMGRRLNLSWLDRLIYRFAIIPITRSRLTQQAEAFAWTGSRPAWGPGRIDPFNPVKFGMLGLADDGTIGNSDMQAIWNLNAREAVRGRAPLHWDGLNTSIREVVISSALGDGAVAEEWDWNSILRVERYLRTVAPPRSPHTSDPAAVERGKVLFDRNCGECHALGGARTLTLIPAQEISTDPHRLAMWTDKARDAYGNYRRGYDWNFSSFQNIESYIAEPLWGLWLNGPYLHNGSVATLADLLKPAGERPKAFVRGTDLLDPIHGGFIAPVCDPRTPTRGQFCYDTTLPGNDNGGHLYGTDLPGNEKADLLAYLLTL